MQYQKVGLIFGHNNNVTDKWGALFDASLNPKYVAHELLIKYGGCSEAGKGLNSEDTRAVQECKGKWKKFL